MNYNNMISCNLSNILMNYLCVMKILSSSLIMYLYRQSGPR